MSRLARVPRLILLNGPPAAGKSTLAQRFADEHPPALNLEIDRLRAMIGGWREDLPAAGRLARDLAVAGARVHLSAGHDVVIPQLVARLEFIARLEGVAGECGAGFCEVFLLPDEQAAIGQYRERTPETTPPGVSDALGAAELARVYGQLQETIAARPGATVITTRTGDVAGAYRELLVSIGG